jgi:hypothetical protein
MFRVLISIVVFGWRTFSSDSARTSQMALPMSVAKNKSRRYVLNIRMSSCEVSLFFSDLTKFVVCCKNSIMNFGFLFVHFI